MTKVKWNGKEKVMFGVSDKDLMYVKMMISTMVMENENEEEKLKSNAS